MVRHVVFLITNTNNLQPNPAGSRKLCHGQTLKKTSIVPLLTDSSCGDVTTSQEAYQAKQVYDNPCPQLRDIKEHSCSEHTKTEKSRRPPRDNSNIKTELENRLLESMDHNYEPSSGYENLPSMDQFKAFATLQGFDLPLDIVSKIEGVVLLCMSLSECQSPTQAMSIFALYMKSHYNKALVNIALDAFAELFEPDTFEDAVRSDTLGDIGEYEPHSSSPEKPQWLASL